ncbi:MAG: lysylphosphatidylglycerol synthase domain-containing protein [Euzebya sp.]
MTRLAKVPAPALVALRWAAYLAVLVVVALVLRDRFGTVGQSAFALPTWWSMAAAVGLFVVANEILVRAWLALVAMGGAHLDRPRGRWVWSSSQLTRYAMGMAQVASRAVVARRHGLRASAGAITTLLEVVWYSCVNGLVAVATIPWWLPDTGLGWAAGFAALPGLVIVLALVSPRTFLQKTKWAGRLPLLRRVGSLASADDIGVTRRDTAVLTLAYVGNFTIRLAGFLALYVGVGGPTDQVLRVVGAFALGHLIGAVAVFAPGGLGPREGVTAVVLAPVIGAGPVLALVAVTRLLELVAELAYAAVARLRWPGELATPDEDGVGRLLSRDDPIEGIRAP